MAYYNYDLAYYLLTFAAIIITSMASLYVNSSYKKYKQIGTKKGLSGQEVARMILDKNGLTNIYVVETKGNLTDHYDAGSKVVRLSTDIYHGTSVASAAVAAHECGHAIQDKENYSFLRIRHALIPFVNFSSKFGYAVIIIGLLFSMAKFFTIGILLEVVTLVFQLVTLPVEFNASSRALKQIDELSILDKKEYDGGKTMLKAAAYTYVASVAANILELVRLIIQFSGRDDR